VHKCSKKEKPIANPDTMKIQHLVKGADVTWQGFVYSSLESRDP